MANTIRLKRGSGSDPSASDLVVGELAIRTDSGKIFTKKDNGSVAEISGGGGIDDGDKGDITVSNGGDTFTIDNGVVSTDKIADDAITAAKIAANAVGSSEIATDAVGSAEIAANAVTSAHIAANTITAGDIATDAVGSAEIAANAVQSAHIANGTIVNADISGSAAIAGSKISPAFTSDITGTGNLALTSTNANSSAGPEIDLFRNSPSPADADYLGQIKFRGENSVGGVLNYAKISAKIDDTSSTTEDGILEFMLRKAGSNNIAARFTSTDLKLINGTGLEVAGNISCDGTVDGVDIATRDTLFGGLTSSSGVLSNGVTATTQSAGNNTTRVATTAFVTTAISNLINGAPGSLDTLNELAAAMNDDAAFSTTVTNSLATKMPLAGGQFTGNITFSGSQTVDGRDLSVDGAKLDTIESNATADQTASEILTLIKTVDGAGSGLDADTLDGISSASFLRSDANDTSSGTIAFGVSALDPDSFSSFSGGFGGIQDGSGWGARGVFVHGGGTGDAAAMAHNGQKLYFGIQNGSSANSMETWLDVTPNTRVINFQTDNNATNVQIGGNKIFHAGNDGSGSGLDADLLDGVQGSGYLNTATTTQKKQGALRLGNSTNDLVISFDGTRTTNSVGHTASNNEGIFWHTSSNYAIYRTSGAWSSPNYQQLKIDWPTGIILDGGDAYGKSGVRMDSDFLPNTDSTYDIGASANRFANGYFDTLYGDGSNLTNLPSQTDQNFTNALKSKLDGIASGATNVTNTNQLTNGAGFITATLTNEQVQDIVGGMVSSNTESGITVTYQDSDGTLDFSVASQTDNNFTNADHSKLDGIESGATADQSASEILTLLKTVDGSGSGLDADLLDGYNQSSSAGNNTIVRRNGSGYVFANYFNTTANDVTTNIVTSIMVESNNDNYIRHGKAGAIRSFLNVEDGATADQSASEILTLIKTVDGAGSGLDADTLDGISSASFLRSDADDTMNNTLTIGTGSGNSRLLIKKADNNVSDHIQFYNGTTRVGEIGCEDNTWLRINQETNKNIYTPRYIRADNGFFVDGTSKGINGSGNFIGGTIAGASDYGTLLRSNAADTATGVITFSGGGGAVTIGGNSDIRLSNGNWTGNTYGKIQQHSNALYIAGGSSSDYSFILRYNANDRIYIKSNGTIWPTDDSSSDIGTNSNRWANVYADNLYGSGANITAINASNISSGTIGSARIADDAITTAKIADGAVNTDRLAGSAVNSTRLADNAVTTSKITNNSVTNAKINSMAASKLTGALPAIDGSALTGISAGATGGGSDEVFYENDQNVTTNYTITNGKNAMAAGPITINSGVTVTVGSGETLTIV